MQDRVPLYPGRVKMTPVAGQANTFDMVRADDPTQAGTPINKATFLKDATAALFGKTNAAVPDDILRLLSKSVQTKVVPKYTKQTKSFANLAVGDTVQLFVNGVLKEFLVVQKGLPSSLYDNSCNGIWLLMKDIDERRAWNNSDVNIYESSDINTYLNNTFLSLLDNNIKDAVKQVKIPYRQNGGYGGTNQSGANGLPTKIFLLSNYEVGWTLSDIPPSPVDGAKLSYFESGIGTSANNKRIARLNNTSVYWWLRSQYTGSTGSAYYVTPDGEYDRNNVSASAGIRPAFILPADYQYTYYTDVSGNIYPEQEYETVFADVLGTKLTVGVQIETGSYVGTGTYGAENPNTLTFGFVPKLVFIFGFYPTNGVHPGGYNGTFDVTSLNKEYKKYGYLINAWSGPTDSSLAKVSEHTLSWYSTHDRSSQLNDTGSHYSYIAIG